MKFPFWIKLRIPGYARRWRWRYGALIHEIQTQVGDLEFDWENDTPRLKMLSNGIFLVGFTTEPANLQVFKLLQAELPGRLPESHFRLMKDFITRYVYPHMRPDLKPSGFSVERLWGFHGQHKDSIADADSAHKYALTKAFAGQPDDVIIDGGAFLGFGEVRIAPTLKDGHIIAVEASADCFTRLRHNVAANRLNNVTAVHRAIWSGDGDLDLESSYAQANSLVAEVHKGQKLQSVRTSSIDSLAAEFRLPKVDMLSLTLNGAEVEALGGAHETLSRWHPRIRLAGWYRRNDQPIWKITAPLLEKYGYRVFAGPRGNVMALHSARL